MQRWGCGMGVRTTDEGGSPDEIDAVAQTVQNLSGNQKWTMESQNLGFLRREPVSATDLWSVFQIHFQSGQTCGPAGELHFLYSGNPCKNQKDSPGGGQLDRRGNLSDHGFAGGAGRWFTGEYWDPEKRLCLYGRAPVLLCRGFVNAAVYADSRRARRWFYIPRHKKGLCHCSLREVYSRIPSSRRYLFSPWKNQLRQRPEAGNAGRIFFDCPWRVYENPVCWR